MKKIFICIILILSALSLTSQIVHQQTYWTRLYVRVKINDNWSWQTEVDNRRFIGENKQLQFIAHTHIHRKLGKNTEGSVGFTFSEVWQGILPVPEFRPFQEFYIYQKLNDKARFTHRFRTEERWFRNYKNDALTEGYNFKFRLRYMLRFDYKLSEKWLLKLNGEVMYHTDDFDQNRIYGGFEYKFRKDVSLELGYLNAYQKRANNKGFFDRDNVRATLYKDFNIKTKK
jgi:Protein of unknown function (DUF2490)